MKLSPNEYMLQECITSFKLFVNDFNNKSKNLLNADINDVKKLIALMYTEKRHTGEHKRKPRKKNNKCRRRKLSFCGKKYKRNLIMFTDGKPVYEKIEVPLLRCSKCGYHAVLPYLFIIPYQQYSIQFILHVLLDQRKLKKEGQPLTVLFEKYQISARPYYRWRKSYDIYCRIYMRAMNSYEMDFLDRASVSLYKLMKSIFNAAGCSIFETPDDDRTLQPPD